MLLIKLICVYLFLLFFLKIINDKYDYSNFITATVVANALLLYVYDLINAFLLLVTIFAIMISNYFVNKYFINSKIILVKDGKFNFDNKSKYSFLKVLEYLKEKDIDDISKVELLYLKHNKLFLEKKKDFVVIINNGKVVYKGLKKLNKSIWWLRDNLKNNNVRLDNILLAFYRNNKTYFIKRNWINIFKML